MTIFNCFSATIRRKKRVVSNGNSSTSGNGKGTNELNTTQTKPENPTVESSDQQSMSNSTSFNVLLPLNIAKSPRCKVKVVNHDSPVNREVAEVAYEGEDERGNESPIRRDMSDSDLQEFQFRSEQENPRDSFVAEMSVCSGGNASRDDDHEDLGISQSGHLSDPGAKGEHWASPKLKRSCSSLDTREVLKKMANQLPPTKSRSFEQLQVLTERVKEDILPGTPLSHTSAMSHFSADKVMLKKHSSSQILPSRSRKLWWKLFLWSHRNLQKPWGSNTRPAHHASFNQLGGYSSDTLEPSRLKELTQPESPDSFPREQTEKFGHGYKNDDGALTHGRFEVGGVGLWPQNQWLAFSMQSSPLQRVDEWVKDLEVQPSDMDPVSEGEKGYPPETGMAMGKSASFPTTHQTVNLSADALHANSVCRSLNSSSTVAHISGMGLKVIPSISHFFRLRSINLSNNSIAHITNGQLPKGLHILDLSRNKISNIEGLRELSRLRVLNLSYNKISRIGHGLSNCTLLKELYLAGNKMSDVEGLHRLLKLTVLDLSFNKITTAKALGQLVANYSSLLALNLLGNPIQSNLSDDQLRKSVCGLLPKLAYLNKQPINLHKARQLATDIAVKASSQSGSSRNGHRKVTRKAGHGGSLLSSTSRSNASVGQKSKNKVNSRSHQQSNLRIRSPA